MRTARIYLPAGSDVRIAAGMNSTLAVHALHTSAPPTVRDVAGWITHYLGADPDPDLGVPAPCRVREMARLLHRQVS